MTQAEIDALRSKLIVPQNHLIDGRNLPSEDGGVTDVISPINGQCIKRLRPERQAMQRARYRRQEPHSKIAGGRGCRLPSASVSYSNGLI